MIDTHCHIDLYPNPQKILQDCEKDNKTIISMTNLPSHFEMGYPYFKRLKRIRLALGMHPLMAEFHEKEFSLFQKNLDKTSYIGEVGLDFSKDGIYTKQIQIETFSKILKEVSGKKKIVSIHSRKAEKEVLELLIKYNVKNAIFHWYSGSISLIDEIVSHGYYFSINPQMANSGNGKKIISKIPLKYVLTETDGPFIHENKETIKPGDIRSVISSLSSFWGLSEYDIEREISNNFNEILKQII